MSDDSGSEGKGRETEPENHIDGSEQGADVGCLEGSITPKRSTARA